jgi:hypothetical protein
LLRKGDVGSFVVGTLTLYLPVLRQNDEVDLFCLLCSVRFLWPCYDYQVSFWMPTAAFLSHIHESLVTLIYITYRVLLIFPCISGIQPLLFTPFSPSLLPTIGHCHPSLYISHLTEHPPFHLTPVSFSPLLTALQE